MQAHSRQSSLKNLLLIRESQHIAQKPHWLSFQLQYISFLERGRRFQQAEKELLSFINQKKQFREQSIALFWLARIMVRSGRRKKAKKYLAQFNKLLFSNEPEYTGYKTIVQRSYRDIIANDRYLKKL